MCVFGLNLCAVSHMKLCILLGTLPAYSVNRPMSPIPVAQWALPLSLSFLRWRHWGSSWRNYKEGEEEEEEVGASEEVWGAAVALRPPAAAALQPWSALIDRRWRSYRGSMTARSRNWRQRGTGCCWRRPRTQHEVSRQEHGVEKNIKTWKTVKAAFFTALNLRRTTGENSVLSYAGPFWDFGLFYFHTMSFSD